MATKSLHKSGSDVMDNKVYSRITDNLQKSSVRQTLKDESGLNISLIDEHVKVIFSFHLI